MDGQIFGQKVIDPNDVMRDLKEWTNLVDRHLVVGVGRLQTMPTNR